MPFNTIVGQQRACGMLLKNISSGRVAHAYLFHGPEGVGKDDAAVAFAQALACINPGEAGDACGECTHCRRMQPNEDAPDGNHPDIIHLRMGVGDKAAKNRLTIDQIRNLQQRMVYAPLEAPYKVIIIHDAETMSAGRGESANAFLKTLEEPPKQTVIILLAPSATSVLETVRSRCRLVPFAPLPVPVLEDALQKRYTLPPAQIRLIAQLSGGNLKAAINAVEEETFASRAHRLQLWINAGKDHVGAMSGLAQELGKDRAEAAVFIDLLYTLYRDVLLVQHGVPTEAAEVINADLRDDLRQMAAALNPRDILNYMNMLTQRRSDLRINVSVPGLIEELYWEGRRNNMWPAG